MPASTSQTTMQSMPRPPAVADTQKPRPASAEAPARNGDGKHGGDRNQKRSAEPEHDELAHGTSTEPEDDTAKATNGRKGKKKKANRACAACQKAHLTCDDSRPCSRCVKKGIGDQCTDGKRKRAKYLLDEEELEAVKAREKAEKEEKERTALLSQSHEPPSTEDTGNVEPLLPPPPIPHFATMDPTQASTTTMFPSMPGPEVPSSVYQPEPFAMPDSTGFPSDNTPPYTFGSEATSLEYSILSAMLNGIDPSLLSGSPDKDGISSNAPFADGPGGITPGASGGLDLKSLFDGGNGGTNLPSVGMASDMSNHWLIDSSRPPGTNPWAPNAAPSPSSFGPTSAAEVAHKALGQLHAIGGGDSNEGEVGTGGFRALEVPSPSPSLASNRLTLDSEAQGAASTPSESGKQNVGIGAPGSGATMHPGGGPGGLHALSMLEAQWRERVNHIYGSLTRPFPYTEGYHFLLKFVTEKFEKAEVLRIVRALGLFRPSLIALQMPLTEEDEVFVERSIQRTILEFEKLISFSGTPTVVWRRTCEICVVGSEFSMLTGWSRELLIGRRIYEFWDKNSTLEYWEKFASHAFENTSQSIVANVVLKRPDGSSVPCAACFSIKRNVFDLPSLVVGAFLPILSAS